MAAVSDSHFPNAQCLDAGATSSDTLTVCILSSQPARHTPDRAPLKILKMLFHPYFRSRYPTFSASKIRVKGVDGWFERLSRALKVIVPGNPDQPVHPNITQPGDDALGPVDLAQPTITRPTTGKANEKAPNRLITSTISPEEYYNLEGELEALIVFLQSDPVANYRITMEQTPHLKSGQIRKCNIPLTKEVDLTAFISLEYARFGKGSREHGDQLPVEPVTRLRLVELLLEHYPKGKKEAVVGPFVAITVLCS